MRNPSSWPGSLALAASVLLAQVAAAQPSDAVLGGVEAVFGGVDVYGTRRFTAEDVEAELGEDLERIAALYAASDLERLETIFEALGVWLESHGPYAYVDVGLLQRVGQDDAVRLRLTVDIVEPADAERRMPFTDEPTGRYADPDGLLALWQEYQSKGWRLAVSGDSTTASCPVVHCLFSFGHPELAPYLTQFNDGARRHGDLLLEIAQRDRDARYRRSALLLLVHALEPADLLPVVARAVEDPDSGVRNDALRIMLYMAEADPQRDYPLGRVIAALDFPGSSERNKAAYTLLHLAQAGVHHETIMTEALPNVLRLLRTEKPNTHEPAYELLTVLSGETYGERDYAAWESWAASVSP